jgi:hypothetical protein
MPVIEPAGAWAKAAVENANRTANTDERTNMGLSHETLWVELEEGPTEGARERDYLTGVGQIHAQQQQLVELAVARRPDGVRK